MHFANLRVTSFSYVALKNKRQLMVGRTGLKEPNI